MRQIESEKAAEVTAETSAPLGEESESVKSGEEKDDTQSAAGSTDLINEQDNDQEAKDDEDDISEDDNQRSQLLSSHD